MPLSRKQRWILGSFSAFVLLLLVAAVAAERYVEPALRKRIGTVIVQGSDSLYNWHIDKLETSLFGGSVEVEGLVIGVDSNRYRRLLAENRLPALTMQVDMPHAHLRGVGLLGLLLGRKLSIGELFTQDAQIELCRHNGRAQPKQPGPQPPLWKLLQPSLRVVALKRLQLEGIRFSYRYASDSNSLQLKFDTCSALIRDIRIDSTSAADVDRIGYCGSVKLHFYDLKFRSPDSAFKLKAKVIDYSSDEHLLSIRDFKLQPTRKDKESFYQDAGLQREMTTIEFARLDLTRFRLEEFLHNNAIMADSLLIDTPQIRIYTDKTLPPTLEGKMGKYPQQQLLHAATDINIRGMAFRAASLSYTERAEKSGQEGTLTMDQLNITLGNITNMEAAIRADSACRLHASGRILGKSSINADFTFFLSQPEGRFLAEGTIGNVQAAQLNGLAEPLAGMRLQSLDLQDMRFRLDGNEYTAHGEVRMRYRNLYLVLQKEDKETGLLKTNKLLTKLVNKYTLRSENPGPDGREMVATNIEQSRLMTQTFFGLIWNTIFSGMQTIMSNTAETVP